MPLNRRKLLHSHHLDAFTDWLCQQDYDLLPLCGDFEVLRAAPHDPSGDLPLLILWKNNRNQWLTVAASDINTVQAFLKFYKETA